MYTLAEVCGTSTSSIVEDVDAPVQGNVKFSGSSADSDKIATKVYTSDGEITIPISDAGSGVREDSLEVQGVKDWSYENGVITVKQIVSPKVHLALVTVCQITLVISCLIP